MEPEAELVGKLFFDLEDDKDGVEMPEQPPDIVMDEPEEPESPTKHDLQEQDKRFPKRIKTTEKINEDDLWERIKEWLPVGYNLDEIVPDHENWLDDAWNRLVYDKQLEDSIPKIQDDLFLIEFNDEPCNSLELLDAIRENHGIIDVIQKVVVFAFSSDLLFKSKSILYSILSFVEILEAVHAGSNYFSPVIILDICELLLFHLPQRKDSFSEFSIYFTNPISNKKVDELIFFQYWVQVKDTDYLFSGKSLLKWHYITAAIAERRNDVESSIQHFQSCINLVHFAEPTPIQVSLNKEALEAKIKSLKARQYLVNVDDVDKATVDQLNEIVIKGTGDACDFFYKECGIEKRLLLRAVCDLKGDGLILMRIITFVDVMRNFKQVEFETVCTAFHARF